MSTANSSVADTISSQELDDLLAVQPEQITTLVDRGCEFKGELKISSGLALLISGVFEGSIQSNGVVIVNDGAEVRGSIRCLSLQVAGTITRREEGDLLDVEMAIVLGKTARVACDAKASGLKSEYGSLFNGRYSPRSDDQVSAAASAASRPNALPTAATALGNRPVASSLHSSDADEGVDGGQSSRVVNFGSASALGVAVAR